MAPRHVDASRVLFLYFSPNEQRGGRGGGGAGCAARLFCFLFFPCSADHERDWSPCKVVSFGLATNTLNARNNNNIVKQGNVLFDGLQRQNLYTAVSSYLRYLRRLGLGCINQSCVKSERLRFSQRAVYTYYITLHYITSHNKFSDTMILLL